VITDHEVTIAGIIATLAVSIWNSIRIRTVHILVNSNLTTAIEKYDQEKVRTVQLEDTMKGAALPVPPRPKSEVPDGLNQGR
jgi:hypothetical protein